MAVDSEVAGVALEHTQVSCLSDDLALEKILVACAAASEVLAHVTLFGPALGLGFRIG